MKYKQVSDERQNVRFSRALFGATEHSHMVATPRLMTTFNAGRLVPVYCREVLPDERLSIDLDFVLRQTTLLRPTMGKMHVDFYAFFVPNRIVNKSWQAVMGENYSGSWTADSVTLAPLKSTSSGTTQIPVGSVADYYDFPTQQAFPNSVLALMHDLKFRGYVMVYNEFFRDQNYEPPIPMSTLNVYQGFLDPAGSTVPLQGGSSQTASLSVNSSTVPNGSFGAGSVAHELYGSGSSNGTTTVQPAVSGRRFRATSEPLVVNKLHDYFTSVLPSPQKASSSVLVPVTGELEPIGVAAQGGSLGEHSVGGVALKWHDVDSTGLPVGLLAQYVNNDGTDVESVVRDSADSEFASVRLAPSNLWTFAQELNASSLSIGLSDIRMASAMQQIYEVLARGGSRYRSLLGSFFGLEVDDIMLDVPLCLGHLSRDLELYQTAQTSATAEGSTPQGTLTGFGYTATSGHLFHHQFAEHGYLHIFAVVRHRNIYSSYVPRDNFRLSMLDYYFPQLSNISEQPVYTREINPFAPTSETAVFGYQEAWAEYRYEPDRVSGQMRPAASGSESLSIWNYADNFAPNLTIANSAFMKSNSKEVLDRTIAVTSAVSPQILASIEFKVDKVLPMPTFSVPGMDII